MIFVNELIETQTKQLTEMLKNIQLIQAECARKRY